MGLRKIFLLLWFFSLTRESEMNLRTRSMTDVHTQSTTADAASLDKIKTSIPSSWIPILCSKEARINHDCLPNCSMFYTKIFEFGLKIPCGPFIPNLLGSLQLAPSQLTPNAWAYLLAFVRLCRKLVSKDSKPNLVNVFLFFFEVGPITSEILPCFYFFLPRKRMKKILPGSDSSIHEWKKAFFCIKRPASSSIKFSSKWGIIPDEFLQNPTLSTEDQAVVDSILGINQSFFLKSFAQGKPLKECEKAAKEFLERTQKGKAAAKLVPNKRKTQAEKMKELAHKLALQDEEGDDDNDAGEEEEEYLRSKKKQIAPMLMSTFSLPSSSTDHFASRTEVDDDSFRSQLYEQVTVAIEPPVEDWDSKPERECVTAIDATLSQLVNIMKAVSPRFCAQGDKISEYNTQLVELRGIMMKKESDLSLSEAKAHGMGEKLKKKVDELMKSAVDDNATIDRIRARKNKYKQDVLLVGAKMMRRAAILFAEKFPLEDVNAILVLDGQPPLKRRVPIEEYDKQQAAKEMELLMRRLMNHPARRC